LRVDDWGIAFDQPRGDGEWQNRTRQDGKTPDVAASLPPVKQEKIGVGKSNSSQRRSTPDRVLKKKPNNKKTLEYKRGWRRYRFQNTFDLGSLGGLVKKKPKAREDRTPQHQQKTQPKNPQISQTEIRILATRRPRGSALLGNCGKKKTCEGGWGMGPRRV